MYLYTLWLDQWAVKAVMWLFMVLEIANLMLAPRPRRIGSTYPGTYEEQRKSDVLIII